MSDVETSVCLQCKMLLPYSERSRHTSDFLLLNSKCHLLFKRASVRYELYLICTESRELFKDLPVKAKTYIGHPTEPELLCGQEVTLSGNKSKLWEDRVNKFLQKFPLYSETDELRIFVILTGMKVTTSGAISDGGASSEVLNLPVREGDDVQQLIDAFSNLLVDTKWADVLLSCSDGKTLRAHSWMLAVRSPFFDDNLKRNKDGGTIRLEVDFDQPTMRHILRYIYVSETPALDDELACALHVAAERFSLDGLKSKCWKWMAERLNEENFIMCLMAAHKNKCQVLKDAVIAFICHHREVLRGDRWKNFIDPSNLAVEVLQRIVTSPSRQRTPS